MLRGGKEKPAALITCGSDTPVWNHRENQEGTSEGTVLEFELPAVLERGESAFFSVGL